MIRASHGERVHVIDVTGDCLGIPGGGTMVNLNEGDGWGVQI